MTTIGDCTSRLRNLIKAVKEDAFLTDRFLYSMVLKYGKMLIRRQDNENKIKGMDSVFERATCVELIEIGKVGACCAGIQTDCTIRRTKDPLPAIMEGSYGPIIRGVSTVDDSTFFQPTYSQIFVSIANSNNYRYNKSKYYWYRDHHLYFPNVEYDAVNIEAIWEADISSMKCEEENKCRLRQDNPLPFPDYLVAEAEQSVLKELGVMLQIPSDLQDDKQSIIRS
jgi:hypothetical protein